MKLLYNTTYNVQLSIVEDWRDYVMDTHIPAVMQEQGFESYKLLRVMTDDESEALTFALQFSVVSIEDFIAYQDTVKKSLSATMRMKYGERCLSFSTLMEIHDEG